MYKRLYTFLNKNVIYNLQFGFRQQYSTSHVKTMPKVHHFADDTNLLCRSNSIKKLNKLANADLKHLANWLNAHKISLNVKKTETEIFKSKQKKFEDDLKIKLCGK